VSRYRDVLRHSDKQFVSLSNYWFFHECLQHPRVRMLLIPKVGDDFRVIAEEASFGAANSTLITLMILMINLWFLLSKMSSPFIYLEFTFATMVCWSKRSRVLLIIELLLSLFSPPFSHPQFAWITVCTEQLRRGVDYPCASNIAVAESINQHRPPIT